MAYPKLIRITTVPMSLHYLLRGQLAFLQAQGFDVLGVSADGKERAEILKEGIDHVIIPFTRKITPVQDLVCLVQLIRLFRKVKPTIVHTHTPKAGLLGMMAAWVCRVPVRMHTVAGLPLMEARGLKRAVLKVTERVTYRCATRVYSNSKGLFDFIHSKFQIPDFKFQIIGRGSSNGIDTTFFSRSDELLADARQIRSGHGIPDEAMVFGFVGRVVRDKGIGELVEAFRRIRQLRTEVYLLVVGPLEQELDPLDEAGLQFLQTDSHVIMAGFQHDVRPWLLASDVFVFPSYREGFPNVVMQAACLEVPCIVTDINGCNEIIEHGVTGLVVPPKDADALYEAMMRMCEDRDLRIASAKKSREFVVANFEQRYVWGELLREYGEQLAINNQQ
jgi:glycosyltransferase involved in cell wall biosynthesis